MPWTRLTAPVAVGNPTTDPRVGTQSGCGTGGVVGAADTRNHKQRERQSKTAYRPNPKPKEAKASTQTGFGSSPSPPNFLPLLASLPSTIRPTLPYPTQPKGL